MLPFFLAGELGWKGFQDNLILILACAAVPSLSGYEKNYII